MICGVWREIASTIDLCYVPVFFGVVIGGLVLGFAELLAAGPYRDYMAKKVMTSEERQQLDQHLHDTGRGWIVAGRRLWLRPLPFAFVFVFGWPLASPTFCETIRCGKSILDTREFIGLPCNKPRSILFGKVDDFSSPSRLHCHFVVPKGSSWRVRVANATNDVENLGFAAVLEDLHVAQLMYDATAAAGYERGFARISSHFIPFLLSAAGVSAGHRVLDVATGTGLAAEAALALVGPTGQVTATDISPQMAERARERLKAAPNATVQIEDGQALGLADGSFDAAICSLGLMFFPDPARGLGQFRTVLRGGARAAVSVNTVPERSFNTRIHPIIARYVPSLAADAARLFLLGNEQRLGALFVTAGFRDVKITIEKQRFSVGSFDEYFDHVERGWGSSGQIFLSLPANTQRAVREDVRRDVGDTGGPIEIEVEYMFGSGQK